MYEGKELYKTMKWAIRSTDTEVPTCNILVYPDWKGEAYQELMAHPRVHILHRVPQPYFSFDTPSKYTGIEDKKAHNAHWDVMLIVVANEEGELKYLPNEKMEGLTQADMTHCDKEFGPGPTPPNQSPPTQDILNIQQPPKDVPNAPPPTVQTTTNSTTRPNPCGSCEKCTAARG